MFGVRCAELQQCKEVANESHGTTAAYTAFIFAVRIPRLSFDVVTAAGPRIFDQLATRSVELVICRMPKDVAERYMVVEDLFLDSYVVAGGSASRWIRRRSIELAELLNERWTLPPSDSFG